MRNPTTVESPTTSARLRHLLAGLIFLLLAACGGGNGESGGGSVSPPPPPPPPPPVFETNDIIVGVLSGVPNSLPVLDNDRPGETIVFVSRGRVGSDIEIAESTITYTSPGIFTGEDNFYYITENSDGERTRAEVALRVDQVSGRAAPITTPAAAPVATSSAADGPYEIGYELYRGIELITKSTTILEDDFNKDIRVQGIPSPELDEGRKQAHVVSARLRAGVRYLISVEYSMEDEDDITPPLMWTEYPQTVITDSFSVPLYDDLCVYEEDWFWDDFWVCHTNQLGVDRLVAHVFSPRDTEQYNLYVWGEVFEFGEDTEILCDELPGFGCGYDVRIQELDDNTSNASNATIEIGGSPVRGSIEREDDTDWFVLGAYATETTVIDVFAETDVNGETLNNYSVGLWDGLRLVRTATSVGGIARLEYEPQSDMSLRVQIAPNSSDTGGYRIESVGGDVPNSTATYARISVGNPVDGRINNGRDSGDWFKVYLGAGTQYDATVTTSIPEIENAFIGLRDSLGESVLGFKQSADLVCSTECDYRHSMSFSLTRSGYYYLTVGAPERGQSGNYELEIVQRQGAAAEDDFAGDATTIARAESMVSSHGLLEGPGDADWFRFFSSFGGEKRTFFVDGAYRRNGLLEYPAISVVDANGNVVATGEIWTDGVQRVDLTATGAADLYLVVSATSNEALPYTVHNGRGDPAGNRDTRAFVGVCSEVHQAIGRAADLDWYNIELLEGQSYAFEISGEDQGFTAATRPRVTLYTQAGDFVGSVTAEGAPATLAVDILESGQYFLEVNNNSGRIGGYRLGVTDLFTGACDQ